MSYNNYVSNLTRVYKNATVNQKLKLWKNNAVINMFRKEIEHVEHQLGMFRLLKKKVVQLQTLPPGMTKYKLDKLLSRDEKDITNRLKRLKNAHTVMNTMQANHIKKSFPRAPR